MIVLADSVFKIGIMKLGKDIMVDILTQQQRSILIFASAAVLFGLLWLVIYLKKSKSLSLDAILAMFAGTLIIYILGSIQGKFVTGLPWSAIFIGWVLPFIVGDTLKLLLTTWVSNNFDAKKYMK